MTTLVDEQVAADAEHLRASGLFDADYYTAQNPEVARSGEDPLLHFCRTGWQLLLRPRADFDVWWYWSNHLDPGRDEVNPFVHYVRHGRAAGLRGLPEDTTARTGAALPAGGARRVCLFAGHDTDGIVDDHVVRYLTELGRFADVYYLADGYLPPSELAKLDGIAKGAWAVRHGAYDFGSYSMLAGELVGWDVIETYDELLLVNDSCYLLRPLDAVFAQMDSRPCAWWGLQATKGLASTIEGSGTAIDQPVPIAEVRTDLLPVFEQDPVYDFHVGSYFVAYRREVIADSRFRRILDSVHRQQSKLAVILKYEVGLTHYLVGNGFAFDTFIDRLYPFHPLFTERAFAMIEEEGFPLLKKYLLYQNHYDVPGLAGWQERVQNLVPDAPVEMFDRNLRRTAPDDRLHRSFSIVRDAEGVVRVPEVRSGSAFRSQDRGTAKYDDWWAFPVSPHDHRLPASSRAILEEVRHDPSITKVVLTRSRPVELRGANVVVLPLLSPEGQSHLWRSRHVFVSDGPRRAIGDQLAPGQHDLVLVRDSLSLTRRGAPTARPARVSKMPVLRFSAFLSASKVDQLSIQGTHYGLLHEQAWRTGIPAHDFLVAETEALPDEVRLAEEQVRAALGGRRLLLFVASHRDGLAARAPYPFSPAEAGWLRDWCARHDAVLGLREHPLDLERDHARSLGEVSMDLSAVRQPMLAPLLRVADAVLTDYSSAALDFMMTGRPVISLAHDLDEAAPSLLYDLEHVFPGPVCRDFAALSDALEAVFDEPSPAQRHRYQRTRRLFLDFDDAGSAARTVRLVREVAESGVSA